MSSTNNDSVLWVKYGFHYPYFFPSSKITFKTEYIGRNRLKCSFYRKHDIQKHILEALKVAFIKEGCIQNIY